MEEEVAPLSPVAVKNLCRLSCGKLRDRDVEIDFVFTFIINLGYSKKISAHVEEKVVNIWKMAAPNKYNEKFYIIFNIILRLIMIILG